MQHDQKGKENYHHQNEERIIFPDGEYEGQALNGKPHGFGKFTDKSGGFLTGAWVNGALHGEYTLTKSNG